MEMEKMIELIDAVSKSDLTGFKYEEDGIKLHLSKKENTCYVTENVSAPVNMTGTALLQAPEWFLLRWEKRMQKGIRHWEQLRKKQSQEIL